MWTRAPNLMIGDDPRITLPVSFSASAKSVLPLHVGMGSAGKVKSDIPADEVPRRDLAPPATPKLVAFAGHCGEPLPRVISSVRCPRECQPIVDFAQNK